MMHLNRDSTIQSSSRRFCTVYKSEKSDPLRPSRRRDILSGSPTVQSIIRLDDETFRPNLPLCREAPNCSSLHPSERFNSTSGRLSLFDQLWDFFPKHKYGKTAATIRTMWIPIRTRSSIRQVVYSKFIRPDNGLHGHDMRASYMEIACIRFIVRTTVFMVWMREALIWKLNAAKVRLSGRQCNIVRTWLNSGKNFCEILESRSHNCFSGRRLGFQVRRSFGPAAYK